MTMDSLFTDIATYVHEAEIKSELAYETARYCLMDSLGCGFLALAYPECRKMLGPVVPGGSAKFHLRRRKNEERIDLLASFRTPLA